MKLKQLLEEVQSWERKADGSLCTLADAIKTHSVSKHLVEFFT